MSTRDELCKLPSVDKILRAPLAARWVESYGRELLLEATRDVLDSIRKEVILGEKEDAFEEKEDGAPRQAIGSILENIQARLGAMVRPTLRPVINATGVILHTNLGRAPLSEETLRAMQGAGEGYSNLEFDLDVGRRGSRYVHAEALLCRLTGAEAALLVNNNAGAVLLVLSGVVQR